MIRLIKDMQYKLLVFNLSDMYLRVLKVYDTNLSHSSTNYDKLKFVVHFTNKSLQF